MFYLVEYFKCLNESLIRGLSFLLLTCALCFSLTHREWVAEVSTRITPEKLVNPYFVAVLDGSVDAEKVVAFINKLPGVISIDDQDSKNSKSKINALVKELGAGYQLDQKFFNLKSLRVVLSPTLSAESLKFVRDQVVKVGGKDHISATEVKFPEVTKVMKSHPFYEFIAKAGDWGIIAIITFCWVISFWLCYDVFRSRSYIIEKFQRKRLVAAKSLAWGLGVIMVSFSLIGLWNGTLRFLDMIILFMIFSIFWTFTLQEWKWKPTL